MQISFLTGITVALMLSSASVTAKPSYIVNAKMVFKTKTEGWSKPQFSWVKFFCSNDHCSWDEMSAMTCIGGKKADPYSQFPDIDHFDSYLGKEIKIEGTPKSMHVIWKDGTGNFWLKFDCSKQTPIAGCVVKSAHGIITDIGATHATTYEYVEPLKGEIDLPCK